MIKKRDFEKEPLQVLSYGGGVQSTAMIFMIIDGILPMPDIIIHSDTGAEMPYTIDIVDQMKTLCDNHSIPFVIVKSNKGKIDDYYISKNAVPVIGFRSCTDQFKIRPQRKYIRSIVGDKNGRALCETWLGITTDERHREFESGLKWIKNKFPLLELNISRKDCIEINRLNGLEIKKSGCYTSWNSDYNNKLSAPLI